MTVLNALSRVLAAPFPEFRHLPPNHMRIRVGVGNRLLFNEAHFLHFGAAKVVQLLDRGALSLDHRVVDIGSGCGRFADALRRHGFHGQYTGIDVDAEMVAWCRGNYSAEQYRFEFVDAYSEVYNPGGASRPNGIPCGDDTQDLVVGFSVLTHVLEDDVRRYLRESRRVLRPGGMIVMGVFCLDDMEAVGALGGRWTFPHRRGSAYLQSHRYPEAAVAYRRGDLMSWMHEAGFANPEVEAGAPQSLLVAST